MKQHTNNTKGRAAIYARYSGQGVGSIERQLEACRDFVRESGMTVGREYVDHHDHPTRNNERIALQELLQDVRKGHFEVLVVDEMDRISRDVMQIVSFERSSGIPVRTADGSNNVLVTPNGAEKKRRASALMAAGRSAAQARREAAEQAAVTPPTGELQ